MSRRAAVAFGLVFFLRLAGPSSGQVLINEIMADPASDWSGDSTYSYKDDEWVEVYNAGTEPVDLSPYWLGDADSTLLYNLSGGLGPGRHRVVCGAEVVEWQRASGRSAVGLRLNNSGDTVMLWVMPKEAQEPAIRGARAPRQPEPVVVDSYTYLNHEAEDDRSSGRVPDGGPAWMLFDGLNPYSGGGEPHGEGCMPTPGGPNACTTPVEDRSWGSVKALYK